MSDLQVALIVLGGLIIAAVVIYNWVQERKLRNEVASEFIVPQKDVLADDFHLDADAYMIDKELAEVTEKIKHFEHASPANNVAKTALDEPVASNPIEDISEPVVSETALPDEVQASEALQAAPQQSAEEADANYTAQKEIEAELREEMPPETIVKAALLEKTRHAPVSLPESTHPQIDLTAILYLTKNSSGNELATQISSIAGIGLPMTLHGLVVQDKDSQDKWHLLSDGSANLFKQVACSLQLADRGGPVAKNLLNKFQFAVEDAGLELNAHVEWQGNGDAMQRAIELDQFCIEVDQLISIHVAENGTPIHGTKFKGLAEASGMTLKEDGKFHFYANEILLFTATDVNNVPFTAESLRSSVLKGVTFQIEIPKVGNCEQVFNQMIMIAQKMASSLNASLVDDNQRQLGDIQIEKIRQQLKVIHATMVARGIMPGSPASMRLFS
jgi:FtsZ-interacting cell division protein ZipA